MSNSKTTALDKRTRYVLILLSIISFFLFADQNLMAPNLSLIANEFGFTPQERDVKLGGNIALGFWMLGGIMTMGIGYLTDLKSRKTLFTWVIILGELPCLLTGFVDTYDQLFWMRALTGIAIGGAMPLTYSLIGDLVPANARAKAAAYIMFAQSMGVAVGQVLSGSIGSTLGWRMPFVIVAIPNFFLIILFVLTVKEPARGCAEECLKELIESGHAYASRINWAQVKNIFKIKTNIMILGQSVVGCVAWGVWFVYLNDFYSQEKGYSIETATLVIMAIAIGCLIGAIVHGLVGNMLYNKKHEYLPLYIGITIIISVIPMSILVLYPSQIGVQNPSILVPALIGFVGGILIMAAAPTVMAMILNVNAPETRGTIISLHNLVNDLGKGAGPAIISLFIVAMGRSNAFLLSHALYVLAGIGFIISVKFFSTDLKNLSELLKNRARQIKS